WRGARRCGAACRRRSRRPTPSWGSPGWPSSSTRSGCSAPGPSRPPATSPPPGTLPSFIYTLLSLGIIMCLLTCSGHIAAETANSPCLSCHMIFVFLLVILEAAIAADVFLNSYWEEDFPDDPSGKFDEFKHFVRSNFDICEWVALSVVAAQ
uniref:Uncharacterized protein n=1 Tax=Aegilops tauschii subsp. strangulata TaxID=200361 RepID=A0A453DGY9_AEGTS